jgi:hypothetical protein
MKTEYEQYEIGDKVKVINQDITGVIVCVWRSEVIIRDDDASWDLDGEAGGALSYHPSELKRISGMKTKTSELKFEQPKEDE